MSTRTPFFGGNVEARIRLGVAVGEWIGTPFRANSSAQGERGGVDCVRLAGAILTEVGAIPPVAFPGYAVEAASHLTTSPLLEFLRGEMADCLEELPDAYNPWPMPGEDLTVPGDLLVLRVGRTPYHLGLVYSPHGDFVHVLRGRRVTTSTLQDSTYATALQTVFRPVAKGVPA